MTTIRALGASIVMAAMLSTTRARADEGMWTFDAFPAASMMRSYGFSPDQRWLDHVRLSAARLTGGCSSSLVSSSGLLLTNHHCVLDCVQALSTSTRDHVKDGFLAEDRTGERRCPGQQAEILTAIRDVTPLVQAAIAAASGEALVKARDAAIASIEDAGCTDKTRQRCEVVTLYGGARYTLYIYRKYSDVRLVFAPEYDAGQFGGIPDDFTFPRFGLDAAFLRIYERGKPVATPTHLRWNPRAPRAGEAVFVIGNPGSTQRLSTQSQLALYRDLTLPIAGILASEKRGQLIAAMAADPDRARSGAGELLAAGDSVKVYLGMYRALVDPAFAAKLKAADEKLHTAVSTNQSLKKEVGDPWNEIDRAMMRYRDSYFSYFFLEADAGSGSKLYEYGVSIVRAAEEREKPDSQRLPGYTQSALPLLEKRLLDPRPVYPWLEELDIGFWLSKAREYLTADHPAVKALLRQESPESLAHRLVSESRLADPAVRAALLKGGLAAVKASSDPMIRFVLANDAGARQQHARYRAQVDGPVAAAQSRLAQARFAVYGDSLYPDATFTLRISYGSVAGWNEAGRQIPPTTSFAGMFDRASGQPPFKLPARWIAARGVLGSDIVLDFSTTNDIVGGNSGSPAVARDGSVIGALFDGNIHSLGGSYGYDPALNRSVIVSTAAIDEVLKKIYSATGLLKELHE